MQVPDRVGTPGGSGVRARIINSALAVLSRRPTRDVELDEIREAADVSAEEFSRCFADKNELIVAVLNYRVEHWNLDMVTDPAWRAATTPEQQLLTIFDVFATWSRQGEQFIAAGAVRILLEMGHAHPLGKASIKHLANTREIIAGLAEQVGLRDPQSFAHSYQILVKGAYIATIEGDLDAPLRARNMARSLIETHRRGR